MRLKYAKKSGRDFLEYSLVQQPSSYNFVFLSLSVSTSISTLSTRWKTGQKRSYDILFIFKDGRTSKLHIGWYIYFYFKFCLKSSILQTLEFTLYSGEFLTFQIIFFLKVIIRSYFSTTNNHFRYRSLILLSMLLVFIICWFPLNLINLMEDLEVSIS